jgi:signal peptidase
MNTAKRTATSRAGDALLTLAAIGGVICIIAVVAAVGFHVTLIMFKTGSMAPTIPSGSLALVHEIPSVEAKVGDVVTIDRSGLLPITHRITSIAPVPGAPAEMRKITMRGDANAADDASPYVTSHVRVVLGSLPGLAYVIVGLANPLVLGGITFLVGALVTWAFWPHRGAHNRRRSGGHGRGRIETSP